VICLVWQLYLYWRLIIIYYNILVYNILLIFCIYNNIIIIFFGFQCN